MEFTLALALASRLLMTTISPDCDLRNAPYPATVTTAAGVINDAKVKIGESIVMFDIAGVGANVVQFGAYPFVGHRSGRCKAWQRTTAPRPGAAARSSFCR